MDLGRAHSMSRGLYTVLSRGPIWIFGRGLLLHVVNELRDHLGLGCVCLGVGNASGIYMGIGY